MDSADGIVPTQTNPMKEDKPKAPQPRITAKREEAKRPCSVCLLAAVAAALLIAGMLAAVIAGQVWDNDTPNDLAEQDGAMLIGSELRSAACPSTATSAVAEYSAYVRVQFSMLGRSIGCNDTNAVVTTSARSYGVPEDRILVEYTVGSPSRALRAHRRMQTT